MTRLNEGVSASQPVDHSADPATHEHAGHEHVGHGEHDHAAQFRDRFWLSLLLTAM